VVKITDFLGEKDKSILSENDTFLSENVDDAVGSIKVFYSEVSVIRHRRRYNNKVYEWVEKRIALPPDFPEDQLAYILTENDFKKLIDILRSLMYRQ